MQLVRLVGDGRDDMRMTVAGGRDGDACGEVEEQIAVHVLNDGPAAALDHQRINARVRWRDVVCIAFEQRLRFGAGQRGANLGYDFILEKPHARSSLEARRQFTTEYTENTEKRKKSYGRGK